ncbi:cytochrome-c peroxidase [Algibacter pacificus]|uniref:cytochrome-c peroxidase n=1 Tax=Algibacter pacificus TaxID=2599389 RepID=UPI0011C92BBA|nr:cytochrome c peroxidase [Algibacter pacificus]
MFRYLKSLVFLIICILTTSCQQDKKETISVINWSAAQKYYAQNIDLALSYIDSLEVEGMHGKNAKKYFALSRVAFKKAEPYASYLNPEVGHRANGPALPIYKEDTGKIIKPVGYQKIEESIYDNNTSEADFKQELYVQKGMLSNLKKAIEKRELNPQRFFIATHQQLLRIVSLAISGFDTPVSHLGIEETIISLESLQTVYKSTIENSIKLKNKKLDSNFNTNIEKAIAFINKNKDFDTFDRFTFTRDYMNPITRNWVDIRKSSALWDPIDSTPFNFDAPTFFEDNSFNLNYFTAAINQKPSDKQIALGKKLFSDPKLSENGKMACISCHLPNKGYADNVALNLDNQGKPLQRNTPTLINTAFQQSFFLDGRSNTLLDQISAVFTNDKEFNSNVHKFSNAILTDSTYTALFKEAFGKVSSKNTDVIKAISSYISTLNGFNSKFDKNIRGEENNFSEEEKLGYNLFMGKALCATCHFMPLTNGTVPPFFTETEKEVIGVPETAENKKLDDDLGFYWSFEEPLHKGMFKTPSIRNIAETAPYMHNGVYKTLEQVVEFYNLGGGGGLGFDLEHQTLPFDELNLTSEEQNALVAFMKTLTATVDDLY